MKISREKEAELPVFTNHEQVREYFKQEYGDRFMLTDSNYIDGKNVYFYNLILNPSVYMEGHQQLRKGKPVMGIEFMQSYQSIEIAEDGHIHIVH